MKIEKMHAYTHSENGASNHVLQKVGFLFMEDYPDKDGGCWRKAFGEQFSVKLNLINLNKPSKYLNCMDSTIF